MKFKENFSIHTFDTKKHSSVTKMEKNGIAQIEMENKRVYVIKRQKSMDYKIILKIKILTNL